MKLIYAAILLLSSGLFAKTVSIKTGHECLKNFLPDDLVGKYKVTIGPGIGTGYGVTIPVPKDRERPGKITKSKNAWVLYVNHGNLRVAFKSVGAKEKAWHFGDDERFSFMSSKDLLMGLGCASTKEFPRFTGTGTFISEDGTKVPCKIQLIVWMQDGSEISGIGVMNYSAGGVNFKVKMELYK